jgi:hypothetical protein
MDLERKMDAQIMVENDVFLHILFPKLCEKRENRVPL